MSYKCDLVSGRCVFAWVKDYGVDKRLPGLVFDVRAGCWCSDPLLQAAACNGHTVVHRSREPAMTETARPNLGRSCTNGVRICVYTYVHSYMDRNTDT